MKIVIAHFSQVSHFPPVISLVANLLNNEHEVRFIGQEVNAFPLLIKNNTKFYSEEIPYVGGGEGWKKVFYKLKFRNIVRERVSILMEGADILWTTTDQTVRWLGDIVYKYKHVMQLMELIYTYPMIPGRKWTSMLTFPIDKYARKAWKVVVPEINRAYIQKAWWSLPSTPVVLPNKPYLTDYNIVDDLAPMIEKMENEKRRIILYSGVIGKDRNLEPYIKAVESLNNEYVIYLLGWEMTDSKGYIEKYLKSNNVIYLGKVSPPNHLALFQYAKIGLLPYVSGKSFNHYSKINALYCAPNKIFEYARFGIPMLGSDVMGLKIPFDINKIGVISDDKTEHIVRAIQSIEENYDEMRRNCVNFYHSVDLDSIVAEILSD